MEFVCWFKIRFGGFAEASGCLEIPWFLAGVLAWWNSPIGWLLKTSPHVFRLALGLDPNQWINLISLWTCQSRSDRLFGQFLGSIMADVLYDVDAHHNYDSLINTLNESLWESGVWYVLKNVMGKISLKNIFSRTTSAKWRNISVSTIKSFFIAASTFLKLGSFNNFQWWFCTLQPLFNSLTSFCLTLWVSNGYCAKKLQLAIAQTRGSRWLRCNWQITSLKVL